MLGQSHTAICGLGWCGMGNDFAIRKLYRRRALYRRYRTPFCFSGRTHSRDMGQDTRSFYTKMGWLSHMLGISMHSAPMRQGAEKHDSGDSRSGNVCGATGQGKLEQKRAKRRSARVAKLGARMCVKGQQDWLPPELVYRFSFLMVCDRVVSPCLFLCCSHTVLPGEKLSGALCLTWILPSSLSKS